MPPLDVSRGLGYVHGVGYVQRGGYHVTYPLMHVMLPTAFVDRQTPVKTLPSATTVAGGNKIKGKGGVFRKYFGARVGGWGLLGHTLTDI